MSLNERNTALKFLALAFLLAVLLSPRGPVPQAAPQSSTPATSQDYHTERLLRTTERPPRDLYELHPRVRGNGREAPRQITGTTRNWRTGHQEQFYVANLQTHEYAKRSATLQHVSGSAYWFVENGRAVDLGALGAAANRFEGIVARSHATFGTEWNPGVDGDPRIVVLVAATPGAGGYYSSADEYPRSINPFSNQHEMIYIDAHPGDPYFDSTLAHEFQHMIHWNEHASQDVWLNEGMSEYAVELNQLGAGLPERAFAAQPDTQLNTWATQPEQATQHYGQAYRLMSYLAGRFGSELMAEIIKARGTGLDAIEQALRQRGTTFHAVYADWLAANLLVTDGRGALGYKGRMTPVAFQRAPLSRLSSTVRQWGADYYARQDNEHFTLRFQASPRVPLVSSGPARSGQFQWYSNRGDLLDTTLTRELDLSGVTRATLEIDLWYDIEKDFDYAYVEVSRDGRRTWRTLPASRTTNTNPNGNNLGNGITGASNGWVTERFDLTPYAGRPVLLRLEYVTDDGYNAQGIVVDGVRVPEIGFADDSETPNGWQAEGWIRSNNTVPGRYRLLVIDPDNGGSYTEVPVGADGRATATFARGTGKPPVVVVGGAAQTTTQASAYELELSPAGPGGLGVIGGRATRLGTPPSP